MGGGVISQFCLITSAKEKTMNQKKKVRDFSKFSEENFRYDISQVNWDALFLNNNNNAVKYFRLFIQS